MGGIDDQNVRQIIKSFISISISIHVSALNRVTTQNFSLRVYPRYKPLDCPTENKIFSYYPLCVGYDDSVEGGLYIVSQKSDG